MMRQILLIAGLFFLFVGSISAKKNCGIFLFNHEGKRFKVYTDGTLQNTEFKTDVKICCFMDERVKLKIEFEDNSHIEGTVFLRQGYIEHTRVSKKGMEHDHYERVPEKLNVVTAPTSMAIPEAETAVKTTPVVKKCDKPMSNTEFYDFFKHMRREHNGFDSEKLTEAKNAINENCFTSKQVKVTMTSFAYESTRLAFAKYAYSFVYDRDQYATVKQSFLNPESGDELDAYIHQW